MRGHLCQQQLSVSLDTIPADFNSQLLSGLLFLVLVLWARECDVGLVPLALQRGPPQLSYPSQCLTVTLGCGISLFHVSSATLPSLDIFILNYKYLFSQSSGGSQGWLVSNLAVVLIWSWEEVSTVFTYSAILTRNSEGLIFV